jgi:hypothetical protein
VDPEFCASLGGIKWTDDSCEPRNQKEEMDHKFSLPPRALSSRVNHGEAKEFFMVNDKHSVLITSRSLSFADLLSLLRPFDLTTLANSMRLPSFGHIKLNRAFYGIIYDSLAEPNEL